MHILKEYLIVLLCLFTALTITGCGIAGDPNAPEEDDSVTLKMNVEAPEINSEGILAAKYSSDLVLRQFSSSGVCMINNTPVNFTLNTQSSLLTIEKLPPADSYEIALKTGALELRGVAQYSGRIISLSKPLSLQSTAEWHLRKHFAAADAVSVGSFADYAVSAPELTSFVSALKGELNKSTATSATWQALIESQVNTITSAKTFGQIFTRQGPAFSFNGTWSGPVSYYLHNAAGKAVMIVKADAEMRLNCSGTSAAGSMKLIPTGVVPLQSDLSGVSAPSETAFAFTGSGDGNLVKFTRQGQLGPLAGKSIDSWELFPISSGLACRATNVDTAYNTGLKTLAGDFVLTRKQ